eukprot:6627026-Alexandrium_andersonii.AAC.1
MHVWCCESGDGPNSIITPKSVRKCAACAHSAAGALALPPWVGDRQATWSMLASAYVCGQTQLGAIVPQIPGLDDLLVGGQAIDHPHSNSESSAHFSNSVGIMTSIVASAVASAAARAMANAIEITAYRKHSGTC